MNPGKSLEDGYEPGMLTDRSWQVDNVVVEVIDSGGRGHGEKLCSGRMNQNLSKSADLG
jgi:hypothetical protein